MAQFSCDFYKEQNLCIARFNVGVVDMQRFVEEVTTEIFMREGWVSGMGILYDLRKAVSLNLTYELADEIDMNVSEEQAREVDQCRRVLLCGNNAVYGQFRMWTSVMETADMALVTKSLDDALKWLCVNDPAAVGLG